MITLLDIYNIIEENGIVIDEVKFVYKNMIGAYIKYPGLPPIIGINKKILKDEKTLLSILAEELGHHFTSMGDLTVECITYSEKLEKSKQELKARTWAANFLISDFELAQAINKSISPSIGELAEYFRVTHEIIECKLRSVLFSKTRFNYITNQLMEGIYDSCNI